MKNEKNCLNDDALDKISGGLNIDDNHEDDEDDVINDSVIPFDVRVRERHENPRVKQRKKSEAAKKYAHKYR